MLWAPKHIYSVKAFFRDQTSKRRETIKFQGGGGGGGVGKQFIVPLKS